MPGLAVGLTDRVARAGRCNPRGGQPQRGSAAGVAPARTLMSLAPGGATGWTMPRLEGVALEHRVWRDERTAATVARSLIEASVAGVSLWEAVGRDPFQFVRSAIKQLVDQHGGPAIARNFTLHMALTSTLDEYGGRPADGAATDLFLSLEPSEATYLVLGPALDVLGREHPRLPATFFHLLSGALNRWIRTYDFRDAREHVDRLRDWYSADDPDCEPYELPNVEGSIPASMRECPLPWAEVTRLLPRLGARCREWMRRALDLAHRSALRARPRYTEAMEAQLTDCNPPLPSLLVVFSTGDNIEACFDAEAQGMLEVSPEPNLVIPFGGTDGRSTRQACATLLTVCKTLAAAAELIEILKKEAPWNSN